MKRSIVILLVVLALIILISPGIVGRLAEKNLAQEIEWAKKDNPDFLVTTEKFNRGWFTSEGTHRVTLRDADLKAAIAQGESMPSLIIDTRFDHGLVPLSSMSQASGSLKPGLARMVSTLHVDDGKGNLTDLPGTIYSETSLTGETTGR
ncbi:MAG: YdgA family protein, partial [Gammaproteobacteria bacterium]|nr:YdgA family protein [Gammaproteobacteria bacterium]